MSREKSLLKSMSTRESGRAHRCRQSDQHQLPKGTLMLVLKIDGDELHYCAACGLKFIQTARRQLDLIEQGLQARRS